MTFACHYKHEGENRIMLLHTTPGNQFAVEMPLPDGSVMRVGPATITTEPFGGWIKKFLDCFDSFEVLPCN